MQLKKCVHQPSINKGNISNIITYNSNDRDMNKKSYHHNSERQQSRKQRRKNNKKELYIEKILAAQLSLKRRGKALGFPTEQ